MTPPVASGGPIRDPLHEEAPAESPPPADVPPPDGGTRRAAPIVVAPEVVQPNTPVPPPGAAAEGPDTTPDWWRRLHLNVGGGYVINGKVYGDAEPFASAAPDHHGGMLLIQPTISAVRSRWFDLNLGLDFRQRWLSVPRSAGSVASDISATSIGALAEGNIFFHPHFGLGANFGIGYMGLSSSNADVGAPYSASLSFDGNLFLGGQLYLHGWNGAVRAGVDLSGMVGGFGISSPGNPDLLTSVQPMWTAFGAIDVLQIVRNAQGRAGNRPE